MKSLVLHLLDNVAQQFLQKLIPLFSFYLPTLQRQLLYNCKLDGLLKVIQIFTQQYIKINKKNYKKYFIYKFDTISKSWLTN